MQELKLRFAAREDTGKILGFIRALAEYENMADEVVATEELLSERIFDKGKAEVILAEIDGDAVGFALFSIIFQLFSDVTAFILKICL